MKRNLVLFICLLASIFIVAGYFFAWPLISPPEKLYFGKIVFGHERTPETTKLFIVRGRQIFLDENGDKAPQTAERITPDSETKIQPPGTNVDFKIASIDAGVSPELVSENRLQKLILYVDILSEFRHQMTGQIELSTAPNSNNYLHFGGPLEFLALDENKLRENESELQDIKIYLGTPSENPSNTTVVVPSQQPPFPSANIRFEFLDRESENQNLTMDHFC